MLIPSITIRLDFGEGNTAGVSGGVSQQGEAPTPINFGAAGLAAASPSDLPTPFTNIAAAAANQISAPTPMSAGIASISAASTVPPVPSLEFTNVGASGTAGEMPRPEGDPEEVAKPPRKR